MLHSGHGLDEVHRSTTLMSYLLPYSVSNPSRSACAEARWPPPVSLIKHITRFCSSSSVATSLESASRASSPAKSSGDAPSPEPAVCAKSNSAFPPTTTAPDARLPNENARSPPTPNPPRIGLSRLGSLGAAFATGRSERERHCASPAACDARRSVVGRTRLPGGAHARRVVASMFARSTARPREGLRRCAGLFAFRAHQRRERREIKGRSRPVKPVRTRAGRKA